MPDRHPTAAPRVIAFDFDGVIADSLEAYFPVFQACCAELGFRGPATRDAFLDVFDHNAVKGLLKAGVPFYKLKRLGRTLAPRVAALNEDVAPFPGIPSLIQALVARHPVYVVTSNVTEATAQFMARHAMDGLEDVIGSDREASKIKKLRRIRKGHPGATVWYIGDTRGDMIEARRAGTTAVAACWGWHNEARLAGAQPDYLVKSPEALGQLLFRGEVGTGF